jgi:signal peptidase complex subunit 2
MQFSCCKRKEGGASIPEPSPLPPPKVTLVRVGAAHLYEWRCRCALSPVGRALPTTKSPPPPPSSPRARAQGDTLNHKRYLDDQVVRSFEDLFAGDAAPFVEDLSWSNVKMGIMTAASASALLAQFYPLPFPANWWLLGGCVVVYFALSGVLQLIVTFVDKDVVYTSKPPGVGARARIRTALPRGSQVYTAIIECPPGVEVAKLEHSVGRYYEAKDGSLVPANVARDLELELKPWREQRTKAAAAGVATAVAGSGSTPAGKGAKGGKHGAQKGGAKAHPAGEQQHAKQQQQQQPEKTTKAPSRAGSPERSASRPQLAST